MIHEILADPSYRPVIESKEFYKLFSTVKRQLDKQSVTHRSAGEFLHLMKTLMAKLKVIVSRKKGTWRVLLTRKRVPDE